MRIGETFNPNEVWNDDLHELLEEVVEILGRSDTQTLLINIINKKGGEK